MLHVTHLFSVCTLYVYCTEVFGSYGSVVWTFLLQNINLGIAKMSVIPENPLFPNPVIPKTSVLVECIVRTQYGTS